MDMQLIKDLLDNEVLADQFEDAQSTDEMQLITLLLIRNNLQKIKGWVTFMGVVVLIGAFLSLLF